MEILINLFAIIGFVAVFIPSVMVGVKQLSKTTKLHLLRAVILAVSTVVIIAAKVGVAAAKPFEYPLIWLRHYVWGSGKALHVPDHLVQQAKEAFLSTLSKYYAEDDNYTPQRSSADPFGAYHCLYHSTIYEGAGFYGRPTLFYLLGGFTFLLRRDGKVSGKDRYDWHPNGTNEEGKPQYFTSPLGNGAVAAAAMFLLDWVFGNEWFVVGGFPSGEHGISNKLWDDLHLVGAAPFWSWFDQVEIFSEKEKTGIWVQAETGLHFDKEIDGVTARMLTNGECGICRGYFLVQDISWNGDGKKYLATIAIGGGFDTYII